VTGAGVAVELVAAQPPIATTAMISVAHDRSG
jgi:hypothetical protein